MSEDLEQPEPGRPDHPAGRTRPWPTVVVFAGIAVIAVLGTIAHRSNLRENERLRREDAAAGRHVVVQWENITLQRGDRVRIVKWAGTFKPDETGFTGGELQGGAGHTGTVLAGERRKSSDHMTVDPAEPIQIVRVRWDAQRWKVLGRDQQVDVGSFEATIHVSYLEVVR